MRRSLDAHRVRLASLLGVLAGGAVGIVAAALTGAAVAQQVSAPPQAVLEATHLPPLLTLPGEPVTLTYEVHCVRAEVEDPEQACDASGSVYIRATGGTAFSRVPLEPSASNGLRQLTAAVPAEIAARSGGFEYYAEVRSAATGGSVTTPSGGADAPNRSVPLTDAVDVSLGTHSFGSTIHGDQIASTAWGDGPFDAGLEQAKGTGAIGASAFDVDRSGTVTLLDEAHHRLLRWAGGATTPARIPISVDGRLADMILADDGSVYVLESVAGPGHRPVVRRFDEYGRELEAVEIAERTPSQIRLGPTGPVVLQQPSGQWMPVAIDGSLLAPERQRRAGSNGRPLRGGGEVVVLRQGNEIRVAAVVSGRVRRGWRITSQTPVAEVQLAQPLGRRLVLIVRLYTDTSAEFAVLIMDQHGLARSFALDPADWAETAPLGRFRMVDGSLYRLGSDPNHAFVDRFDLEVR